MPFAEELEEEKENPTETELTEKQKHQLRHRELFLSRQYESLPATHIRYFYKDLCTTSSPGSAHGLSVIQALTDKSNVAHFLCHCFTCSLHFSLIGGNAVLHYWTRLKQFFHTLTKRWVEENKNWFYHLLLGFTHCRLDTLCVRSVARTEREAQGCK